MDRNRLQGSNERNASIYEVLTDIDLRSSARLARTVQVIETVLRVTSCTGDWYKKGAFRTNSFRPILQYHA